MRSSSISPKQSFRMKLTSGFVTTFSTADGGMMGGDDECQGTSSAVRRQRDHPRSSTTPTRASYAVGHVSRGRRSAGFGGAGRRAGAGVGTTPGAGAPLGGPADAGVVRGVSLRRAGGPRGGGRGGGRRPPSRAAGPAPARP